MSQKKPFQLYVQKHEDTLLNHLQSFALSEFSLAMGKRKLTVSLHFDQEEIQPKSPTAVADLDLVIQVSSNISVPKTLVFI